MVGSISVLAGPDSGDEVGLVIPVSGAGADAGGGSLEGTAGAAQAAKAIPAIKSKPANATLLTSILLPILFLAPGRQ